MPKFEILCALYVMLAFKHVNTSSVIQEDLLLVVCVVFLLGLCCVEYRSGQVRVHCVFVDV
jgi:uncharacterized membrane protein YccC